MTKKSITILVITSQTILNLSKERNSSTVATAPPVSKMIVACVYTVWIKESLEAQGLETNAVLKEHVNIHL